MMITKNIRIFAPALLVIITSCSQQPAQTANTDEAPSITFRERPDQKRIDVLVDGNLFTSYQWPEGVYKPVLYPILTPSGTPVTRGFPLEPREGESEDHRHQVGNWLNYGDVNGYDFWGNGHSGERSANGGEIRHTGAEVREDSAATLHTTAEWLDPSGKVLLTETTDFHFSVRDSARIIDRITTLTAATNEPVRFTDTKEGMFGIRVARQLELPDEKATGGGDEALPDNAGPTGNYVSSEGITGADVWSTRARWMDLYGAIGGEKVSLVVCDHPKNINYPTYWHARGYGLFSANPLGVADFTKGKERLNFALAPGESVTFRYRIVLAPHHLPAEKKNLYADEFARLY